MQNGVDLTDRGRTVVGVRAGEGTGVRVDGKFLAAGNTRLLIKGVTYGTFAPNPPHGQFPSSDQVAADMAQMARHGINTVRTYTVPPLWMLDEAARNGLRVVVGLPWSQHVAFLDDRVLAAAIRRETGMRVRELGEHPAVMLIAIGNEIPAPVVRWHGYARTERFLRDLYDEAKAASPSSLVTYVNYPPTEYLELPFFDVCAFNVYLHREADLRRYVARLQHVAGPRPLLLAEAGADSVSEGPEGQAALAAMQVRAGFAEGACGVIAFAWTDEWWRGGHPVEDWSFGLVDRRRQPKPALAAVARAFADAPFSEEERRAWPSVSVVVCAYNAAATIDECLESIGRLAYPSFDVIVVDDGSQDGTGEIAGRHPRCRVISVPNGGLSAARNIGLGEATGDIVAYTDADVRVDPDWLSHLVQPFLASDVVGTGGPNVVPADDPWVAQCVARSPGGPTHVLLDDRLAEHVPGCNMAFRREALVAIGGFDPTYLRAGDDVDVCWRIQKQGWRIGFAPAALVWHRHRDSVRAYWKQQVGYGEGQQWLMPHHPDKFAGLNITWRGHIYSPLPPVRSMSRARINSGPWGTSLFPSVYRTNALSLAHLPHSARWLLTTLGLGLAGGMAAIAGRTDLAIALSATGAAGFVVTLLQCLRRANAADARSLATRDGGPASRRWATRALIAWLHFIQPLARARGRLRGMLSTPHAGHTAWGYPRRLPRLRVAEIRRGLRVLMFQSVEICYWSERWTSRETVLAQLLHRMRGTRLARMLEVDDGWQPTRDISVSVGARTWLDLRALVEEHGGGRCLVRIGHTLRPRALPAAGLVGLAASLAGGLWLDAILPWPFVTTAAGLTLAATVWRVSRRVMQAVAISGRALELIAADGGMVRMPDDLEPRGAREGTPAVQPEAAASVSTDSARASGTATDAVRPAHARPRGGLQVPRPAPASLTLSSRTGERPAGDVGARSGERAV